MDLPFGIHWFRRDLRIAGNPALHWNRKETQGRTLGVFFFDSKFLARPDFSHRRFGFFLKTLESLQEELRATGGDLLVLDEGPDAGFERLLSLLGEKEPNCISFNRDYEPFARDRDARILVTLQRRGLHVHTERDHLLVEPQELTKNESGFYQVYTPFSKRWQALLQEEEITARITSQREGLRYLEQLRKNQPPTLFHLNWKTLLGKALPPDQLNAFLKANESKVTSPLPQAGSLAALEALTRFRPRLPAYPKDRDFPSLPGTSQLSIYLKNGSLTSSQVIHFLNLHASDGTPPPLSQYLKELAWREFYYHILWHQPRVENEAFLVRYNNLKWDNREKWFEAWKNGQTGFPIVDAGMRQLKATGWMHNRVRMIVASFLTKDLLIDWRWGEAHFMKELLDGDLAPNNGGWQWAASTGCDPQPYFRIFNPTLQSEKFDPEGTYIRQYVPELAKLPTKLLHPAQKNAIVSHSAQREKALSLYKRS